MEELKLLKAKYENGKIKREEYLKQLDQLLNDENISQEEHDEAKEYDPEQGETLIYSQSDVNRIVKGRALREIRKYLRNAGVEDVDDLADGEIEDKVVELVTVGAEAGEVTPDDKELKRLKDKAAKADQLEATIDRLSVENGVYKVASKYKPYDTKQVVRALTTDYSDLLEYEDGNLVEGSVEKAVERVVKAEPNLFPDEEGSGKDDDTGDDKKFKSGGPGGGGGKGNDNDRKKKVNSALEKMGFKKDE